MLAPVPFDTSPLFVLDHDPDPAAPKQESRSQSDGDLSQMISSFRHLVKVMKQAHKQCNIELKSILIQIDTEPDFKPMRDLCRTIRNTPLAKLMMPAVCRQYINELLELSRTYFFSLIPTRMLQSFCQLSRLVENIESEAWMFDYMVKPLHERIPNEINSIVFNIDKEGCVSYVSAAIRDVLGLDPKGLLGLPPRFANLSRPVPNIACTHADGRVIFLESKCVFQNKDDTNPSTWTLRPRQPISPSIPGTPLAPSPDSETLCHVCEKHVPVVLFPSHSLICLDMHAQEMQLILLRATIQTLQQTVSDALALLNEEWEAERDDAANAEYCRFLSRLVVIGEGVREWLTRASRSDFIEPIPPLKMIEEDFLPESGPDALPIAEALLTVADQLWEGVQEANATGDAIFTLSATITEKRRVFKEQSTAEEAYRNQSLKAQDRPSSPAVGAERPASIKDYDVLKPISKGSFGRVFLAKKKLTGEYFAIKVLKKQDMVKKNQLSNVALERTILTQLDSPYIVKMYFSFQTGDNIYLVMEYLNGGDCAALLKSMGHLDEKWARFYMCEITLGLEFLHGRDVVHRDLKPDNLLIDAQGHLKLTDFGLSKVGFLGRRIDDRRDSTTPNSPVNRRSSIAHSPLRRSSISSATSSQHEASTPVFGSRIADKTDKFVGTPDYLAPESVLGTSQEAPVDWVH